jgi:hypothetical protein
MLSIRGLSVHERDRRGLPGPPNLNRRPAATRIESLAGGPPHVLCDRLRVRCATRRAYNLRARGSPALLDSEQAFARAGGLC